MKISLDDMSRVPDLVSTSNATAMLTSDLAGTGHLSVGGDLSVQDPIH